MYFSQRKRFNKIIEPNYKRIYHFLLGEVKNKEIAENLTQNTMEKAWSKLDQLKDDKVAYAWCIQIAKNEIKEDYRKAATMKRSLYTEEPIDEKQIDIAALQQDILENIILREDGRQAMVALMNVKELYRTVLSMKLISGLSLEEIARTLETNGSTIRNRYARGLVLLRTEYEKNEWRMRK